jgi:nitrite reductase (NADH) large subunit
MAIGAGAAAWLDGVRRPRAQAAAGTLAVIGNGMASHRLCARLSEAPAPGRRVVVIAEEARPAYDRVRLSDVLGGRDAAELELASASWYRARGIELWLGEPAVRIDLAQRCVETGAGRTLGFDRLVFATGSAPVLPPLPGVDLPGVHVYRSADDVRAIARAAGAALARGATAGIIGGGLLGIELAGALRRLGLRVVVLERATHLLPRQLDVAASRVLERQIRALGIWLALGRRIDALERAAAGVRVRTNEGSADFAFVVVAAGVRPRDALARAAGIACHEGGGILVDDQLRASAADVYAVGECARHAGVSYGLAAPCLAMADALADRLRGGRRSFRRVAPATRLKLAEVDVSVAGNAHLDGPLVARVTHARADAYRSLVLREGRVVGAVAVGDWPEWPRVQEAIASQRLLMPWQRLRLTRKGVIWPAAGGTPISRWPDATIVCSCTGVDCGGLRAALSDGCRTASALAARTGASSVCGSCRPLLEALSGERVETARESAGGGLLPSGIAAAALVALIALAPPIALAASVRGGELAGLRLDTLWRNDLARQISGFATLAICAGSLLFSLRKRWPRLASLSYTRWRGLHAALGVGTLLGLGAHTGFRLGSQLDRALVVCFLALAGLGALAGVVTALESRLSPAAGSRLRRATSGVHALAFWPFPVLVFFHVLKTYWY